MSNKFYLTFRVEEVGSKEYGRLTYITLDGDKEDILLFVYDNMNKHNMFITMSKDHAESICDNYNHTLDVVKQIEDSKKVTRMMRHKKKSHWTKLFN